MNSLTTFNIPGGDVPPVLLSLAGYIYEKIASQKRVEVFSLAEEMKRRKGTWGLTGNFVKKIYIPKTKEIILTPDFYFDGIPLTEEETLYKAMEKELNETFGMKRLRGYVGNDLHIAPPIYAEDWEGEGVKVDVKACYYTIYSAFGLDATVIYGGEGKRIEVKAIGLGIVNRHNSQIIDGLAGEKLLRNTLYGFTRARLKMYVRWIDRWETKQANGTGTLYNPNLYQLACILTNALYGEMRRRGVRVRYWHTDGGIVDIEDKEKAVETIQDFGFTPKIEAEGHAIVRGVGSYKVGEKTTKPYVAGYGGGKYENTYEVIGLDIARVRRILQEGGIRL